MSDRPSFQRHSVAERKRLLVEAVVECFAKGGADNLSIRAISKAAGVSVGLINHHYANKDALIAETYRTVVAEQQQLIEREVLVIPATEPRRRLDAFIATTFSDRVLDPGLLMIWVHFWRGTERSEAMRRIHDESHGETLQLLADLFRQLLPDTGKSGFDPRIAAVGLAAMMDGLWLEWSLNPANFTPKEAVRLCQHWVDSLLV
ncbi:AcrR family transcriptional regulator [Rhodobium orientis]|uniref:HTH tetR-type domain-containing protein n=1 Tax=Rhodobium orientis TaxID=34017 RepID=A0A327JIP8_9HYPH|nr:TetR family transcriptional regulator C-terminal domain-containing protein [Rhodobium orientis]MBB4303348.1 AcrR family transcriptional regulator [Rhodobium orientis]MBK5951557.1 hypothetical protein [Rhodobium orientis]RAI24702.1 hypothetical protein CH339_21510 [Rhodobium orientis]